MKMSARKSSSGMGKQMVNQVRSAAKFSEGITTDIKEIQDEEEVESVKDNTNN